MKRLKYIGALALAALLGLWSCSTDTLTSDKSVNQDKGHKVSLTIGSIATTRTAAPTNLGGFDREKAIDGNQLYAVVFDQQGKFFETIQITDYNSGDGTCSFTLSAAGVYYGYIVANTSKGTALTGLTVGTSTEDDMYNIIEDTDPGANLAASTNFLMISKRTLLDVDGDADTALGSVTLTRAVARIDIDATTIDGLAITQVVVENRYKKSLIVRGNTPDDTGLTTATPTDTKTYTRGTSAGQVDALSDGTGLVNDQQWQGVIYGYENINTNTVVKITHTLNGVASTTIVDFADANSGSGQAVKRNNIYTVKLTSEALTPTLSNIVSTITVLDWDTSVNLAYTDLTDHEKPDYIVTSGHYATEFTSSNLNPGKIRANRDDAPTEITLQITSNGKVASEVAFVNKTGAAYDFVSAGGVINQTSESLVAGKIVQNYSITIPQAVIEGLEASDYFTFKVHNVFDDTSAASREFKVTSIDKRWNPLWWMANYNLDYNGTNAYSFPNTNDTGNGYMFAWQTIMNSRFAKQSTYYDGWQIPSGEGHTPEHRTIDGVAWHMPTSQEWRSIIPCYRTPSYFIRIFATSNPDESYANRTVVTEPLSVFGFNSSTQTATSYYSYWSDITDDNVNEIRTRYAIRFLDENYCSVWKYEVRDHYTIIRSKLISPIGHDETTKLSNMMDEITSPSYNWDESTFDEDCGEISRKLYASGYNTSTGSDPERDSGPGPGNTGYGNPATSYRRGHWWTATQSQTQTECPDYVCLMYRNGESAIYIGENSQHYGFSIRLFRDE